ncbi:hypothetical protein [Acetobacter sp. DsW_063]|uniref:hypothetical protein n=1 Tax=Acetobacter sp. DsW_063 TaxID=1514894 RepID=UPI0011777499|nr:hypothetical protein [Acetobacter sp. DsW_063]
MSKRSYNRANTASWDEAAELNSRGHTQTEIAAKLGVSERSVATHLPAALERRRKAIAASPTGSASTSPVPSVAIATIPDVADREAATRHWRQTAWADTQALQARLRSEMSNPAPDAKAIRALSAGAEALRNLIRTGAEVLEVSKQAADIIIPELVVRTISDEEVADMRRRQRAENGDLDDADLALMKESLADESAEGELVVESDE